eukprot:TRINITY_DN1055_c0_g1_i2.p1 TRINITY_DN1055_c0_g1~~TRINITY_DN1055_c0_g1_i2.p1  ORF type:complete len:382 (+),score=70.86 TRINITY_DN1055_c0_g1_i2:2-1147(+)
MDLTLGELACSSIGVSFCTSPPSFAASNSRVCVSSGSISHSFEGLPENGASTPTLLAAMNGRGWKQYPHSSVWSRKSASRRPLYGPLCLRVAEETQSPGATQTKASTLADTFAALREQGKVALIPFIMAGDPALEATEEVLVKLDECGADIIELGVPYSDPLADGPVIHAAATRALQKGTDLSAVLSMLKRVSGRISVPVVLFTYFNPIMKKGLATFMATVREAGATGLVVPDVPLEETGELRRLATANGLELVLLTTPTTPRVRMAAIAEASQGFLYLVSLTGVTGARAKVEGRVETLLQQIKQETKKPVAVGFGISTPEQAVQVAQWGADGIIIGSALVRLMGEKSTESSKSSSSASQIDEMLQLFTSIKAALSSVKLS